MLASSKARLSLITSQVTIMCQCVTWEASLRSLHTCLQSHRAAPIAVWQQRVTAWMWCRRSERYNCCDCSSFGCAASSFSPVTDDPRSSLTRTVQPGRWWTAWSSPGVALKNQFMAHHVSLWSCNTRQQRETLVLTLLIIRTGVRYYTCRPDWHNVQAFT